MRLLWIPLSLFLVGFVGCDSSSRSQNATQSAPADVETRKAYQETGLDGVYLVDATAEAKSALQTYFVEYDFIAELLSDQPLQFSLTTGDEEPQFLQPQKLGKATYQYFVRLTRSDNESVRKWHFKVNCFASEQITLGDALEMKPNERLANRGGFTWGTTQSISKSSLRVEGPSSTPTLRENGIVSIWSTGALAPDPETGESRVYADQFSLDVRTMPNKQEETETETDAL